MWVRRTAKGQPGVGLKGGWVGMRKVCSHCPVTRSPVCLAPQLHAHLFCCPLIAYLRPHLRPHPRGCTPTCLAYAYSPVYQLRPHTGWQLYRPPHTHAAASYLPAGSVGG